MLTQKQKKRRLKWAKERIKWLPRDWYKIIWSEESRFELAVGDARKRIIRKKCEGFHSDCLARKVKFPASVMVWGCMSASGVGSLYLIEGTVNAEKYIQLLDSHLLPSIPRLKDMDDQYIFQQDGASCHTAKKSLKWLSDKNIPVLDWPSSSPDLSPIETLWGVMKKKLRSGPPRTVGALKLKLQDIWDSFTPEYCRTLVATMPKRVEAVVKAKGDVTQF